MQAEELFERLDLYGHAAALQDFPLRDTYAMRSARSAEAKEAEAARVAYKAMPPADGVKVCKVCR
jgi:hypothetical protein